MHHILLFAFRYRHHVRSTVVRLLVKLAKREANCGNDIFSLRQAHHLTSIVYSFQGIK